MALPTLLTLEDCADYSKTVEPFLPQLYSLPEKLLDVVTSRQSISSLYIETNPLVSGFAISVFLGAVFLVASEINRNYSQVDRFWTFSSILQHVDVFNVSSSGVDRISAFSLLFLTRHSSTWKGRDVVSVVVMVPPLSLPHDRVSLAAPG